MNIPDKEVTVHLELIDKKHLPKSIQEYIPGNRISVKINEQNYRIIVGYKKFLFMKKSVETGEYKCVFEKRIIRNGWIIDFYKVKI